MNNHSISSFEKINFKRKRKNGQEKNRKGRRDLREKKRIEQKRK
jgi:hypothetical protein